MGDILIIGGGFAGLEAARVLSRDRKKLGGRRVLLLDAKKTFDFLPVLPDVLSGRVNRGHAVLDLADYLGTFGVNFEHNEVIRVDPEAKEVFLKSGDVLGYEFLIVSCGSSTNFYGLGDIRRRALKIDNAEDAAMLAGVLSTYPSKRFLVVGGGYTGIEVASHLALFLRRKRIKNYSVNIIEKEQDILGSLPEWMKDYCRINLCALRVNIYAGCSLEKVDDGACRLSNGIKFENYLLVWAAGVETPAFVRDLKFEKDRQGRLVVDPYMRFAQDSFAVGDAACFKQAGGALRMSVQFSLAQARVAALNIVRLAAGKKRLGRYRPLDIGLFVPMANRKACGRIFMFRVWGFLGWFLSSVACVYRSIGLKNKLGITGDMFLKIGR